MKRGRIAMPGNSPSASTRCAGYTPNGWCISWTLFTDRHRAAQQRMCSLIWDFYADLKAYRANPDRRRRTVSRARFDRIFRRRTGFATLDRLLARLWANKVELLKVLDRPDVPLHTNGSENDIRCHVTRRKLSAGTRSDHQVLIACVCGPVSIVHSVVFT
jgi:hypothetical protein